MADTLVDDYDVIDLLTGLADRCVSLLDAAAAGVMLANPRGELTLVASSSEAMRLLEMFEIQSQEGPCVDAFRSGRPVEQEQLSAGTGRWPRFATLALDNGFHSAFALPLRLRDVTVGALNLFYAVETPMDESDAIVAKAFADLAAISVLQHRAVTQARLLNDQLAFALNSRIVIEQAKGVLSERAGIPLTEAFERLRSFARCHGLRLTEVAQAAVEGTLEPSVWASEPDGPLASG
jgi:GAF domain-containing protein